MDCIKVVHGHLRSLATHQRRVSRFVESATSFKISAYSRTESALSSSGLNSYLGSLYGSDNVASRGGLAVNRDGKAFRVLLDKVKKSVLRGFTLKGVANSAVGRIEGPLD